MSLSHYLLSIKIITVTNSKFGRQWRVFVENRINWRFYPRLEPKMYEMSPKTQPHEVRSLRENKHVISTRNLPF